MKRDDEDNNALIQLTQPLTAPQLSRKLELSVLKCRRVLYNIRLRKQLECLNPASSCYHLYWLTQRGAQAETLTPRLQARDNFSKKKLYQQQKKKSRFHKLHFVQPFTTPPPCHTSITWQHIDCFPAISQLRRVALVSKRDNLVQYHNPFRLICGAALRFQFLQRQLACPDSLLIE